jgi:hypothetical protein
MLRRRVAAQAPRGFIYFNLSHVTFFLDTFFRLFLFLKKPRGKIGQQKKSEKRV